MGSRSRSDFTLLLSLGMVPLAACEVDVADNLTAGPLFMSAGGESGNGTGDDDGGQGEAEDDGAGDDDDGGPIDDADDDDDAPGADDSNDDGPGGDPSDASASSTDVDPGAEGYDTDEGEDGNGESYGSGGYGMYAEICAAWGMHAQECVGDGYAASYCQYDLDYAQSIGGECPGAVEDFYSCLVAADCAELTDPDALPCDDAPVAEACG